MGEWSRLKIGLISSLFQGKYCWFCMVRFGSFWFSLALWIGTESMKVFFHSTNLFLFLCRLTQSAVVRFVKKKSLSVTFQMQPLENTFLHSTTCFLLLPKRNSDSFGCQLSWEVDSSQENLLPGSFKILGRGFYHDWAKHLCLVTKTKQIQIRIQWGSFEVYK